MEHREEMEQQPRQAERTMRRVEHQTEQKQASLAMQAVEEIQRAVSEAKRIPLWKGMIALNYDDTANLLSNLHAMLPAALKEAHQVLTGKEEILQEAKTNAAKTRNDADAYYKDTVGKANRFKDDIVAESEAYEKNVRLKAQEEAQAILADAQTRAEQVIFAAQQQAQALVDDNEITRRAQAYAMETRERAEKDADSIYNQACVHADKMLSGAAAALNRSAGELAQLRDTLLGSIQPPMDTH